MPPRAKFSKREIEEAALSIVRTDGIQNLTARALGTKLGSSSRPIFTVFENMEEVKQCVNQIAKSLYKEYIQKGLEETHPFKGVGIQYILFAINEPNLFHFLFMSKQKQVPNFDGILFIIEDSYESILSSIENEYKFDKESAKKLYQHMWIYTHGIATLCATKMCSFTDEEISSMLTEVCMSLLKNMKGVKNND